MPSTWRTVPPRGGRWVTPAAPLPRLPPLPPGACNGTGENNPADTTPGATSGTTSGTGACPDDGGLSFPSYSPKQMRVAYGIESLCQKGDTGRGQTVIVIESFGSPTLQQDVDTFSQRFNLPRVPLDIRAPLGTKVFDYSNSEMTGWAVETSLD